MAMGEGERLVVNRLIARVDELERIVQQLLGEGGLPEPKLPPDVEPTAKAVHTGFGRWAVMLGDEQIYPEGGGWFTKEGAETKVAQMNG